MTKKKTEKTPEPHWQDMVNTYFATTRGIFPGEEPAFDGPDPRDLLGIVKELRKRAEKKNIEWTREEGTNRLKLFLETAATDEFFHDHWVLSTLNRHKNRVFFGTLKKRTNGTATYQRTSTQIPDTTTNSSGNFGKLQ